MDFLVESKGNFLLDSHGKAILQGVYENLAIFGKIWGKFKSLLYINIKCNCK